MEAKPLDLKAIHSELMKFTYNSDPTGRLAGIGISLLGEIESRDRELVAANDERTEALMQLAEREQEIAAAWKYAEEYSEQLQTNKRLPGQPLDAYLCGLGDIIAIRLQERDAAIQRAGRLEKALYRIAEICSQTGSHRAAEVLKAVESALATQVTK